MKRTREYGYRSTAAILFLLSACVDTARATSKTWDGGGNPDGSWNTGANWDADTAPAATGDTLTFAGSTGTVNTNTHITALATSGTAITFASGASSFLLKGNAITVGSGGGGGQTIIQQNSASPQEINLGLNLSGGNGDRSIVFGAGAGALTLSGNINFGTANGDWLFPTTTAGTITLSGNNTGDGKLTAAVSAGSNVMRAMMRNNVAATQLILGSDACLGNSSSGDIAAGTAAFRGLLANQQLNVSSSSARSLGGSTFAINANNITYNGTGNLTLGSIINVGGNRDFVVSSSGSVSVTNALCLSHDQTGRNLYLNLTGNMTISGKIYDTFHSSGLTTAGSGQLRKAGTGTLTINGANSFTNMTSAEAGVLVIGNDAALGVGVLNLGGGTVAATTSARSIANAVRIGADSTIGGSLDLTISGAVTNYNSSRILTVNNSGLTTLSGSVYLSESSTSRQLDIAGTGNIVISGVAADSNGAGGNSVLRLNNSGTLTLSNANTYSGGTTLSAGNLVLGNKAALGTGTASWNGISASASVDLSGANAVANTVSCGGNNTFTGSNNIEFSGTWTDSGTRSLTCNMSGAMLTLAGPVNLSSGSSSYTLTMDGTGNSAISGNIANGGTATACLVAKSGSGTLTLSGNNTYAGGTTLTAGTLVAGSGTAFGSGTLTMPSGTPTLELNGQTVGNALVSGATGATIANSAGTTATVSSGFNSGGSAGVSISDFYLGGTGNTLWSGAIHRTSGTGMMTKNGTGTATINGAAVFLGMNVTVANGTLFFGKTSTSITDLTITGGTLKMDPNYQVSSANIWSGTIANTVSMNGGTWDLNGTGINGVNNRFKRINGTGGLISNSSASPAQFNIAFRDGVNSSWSGNIQDGVGTVAVTLDNGGSTGCAQTFGGTNTYSGATTINQNTFQAGSTNACSPNSDYTLSNDAQSKLDLNNFNNAVGSLAGANASSQVTLGSGTLTTGGKGTTTTFAGIISGSGGVVKSGGGAMTLSAVSTYTGGTTVNNGTLVLAASGAAGTIRGTLTVNAPGVVTTTGSDSLGYTAGSQVDTVNLAGGTMDNTTANNQGYRTAFNLTGGTLSSSGGGKYNFTTGYGINALASAATSLISGPIQIRDANNMPIDVANGAATVDLRIAGAISENGGSGAITKTGDGVLELAGANSYSGGTTISAGALRLGAANAVPSSGTTTVNGTLDLNTYDETLTTVAGAASGMITNSGTAAATLTVTSGTFAGTVGDNASNGGTLNLAKSSGSGTLTLSGNNTFAGSVTFGATPGKLELGHTNAVRFATVTLSGGSDDILFSSGVGGEFNIGGLSGTSGQALTDTASAGITLAVGHGGATSSYGGVLSGSGGALAKVGSGTFTLVGSGGASSYTGNTTVRGGTLVTGGGNDHLPAGTVMTLGDGGTGSGKWVLGEAGAAGRNQTVAGLQTSGSGAGNAVVGGNSNVGTLTVNLAAGSSTFAGALGGAGANENNLAVTKTGAGTWTISGNHAYVGATSASGGTMILDGGSLNGTAGVGVQTAGTTLIVSNGASISSTADSGVGNWSHDTTGTVADAGTTWNLNAYNLRVGYGTAGANANILTVSGGAVVTNVNAIYIGDNGASTNNQLVVTGGSALYASGIVRPGQSGGVGNGLLVQDGSTFVAGGILTVGIGSNGTNHYFQAGGAGAASTVRAAGIAVGGSAGYGNQVIVTNASVTITGANNTAIGGNASASNCSFIVRSGGLYNANTRRLETTAGQGNTFIVDGGVATNFNELIVGNSGSAIGTAVIVTNGGTLYVDASGSYNEIGRNTGSRSNRVVVTGAGSRWLSTTRDFGVGGTSGSTTNNSVEVSNGGLWSLGGMALNMNNYGSLVTIDGGTVTNVGSLIVGNSGLFNEVRIQNGGRLYTGAAGAIWDIGRNASGTNNAVTVNGAGSLWNAGTRTITLGNSSSAGNNALRLQAGGVFTNGSITVGGAGAGSVLDVDGGTAVLNGLTISANNSVFVTNSGALYLGGNPTVNGLLAVGGGGVLGANADWSCTQNFVLTNGAATVQCAGQDGTAHNIGTLTGVISGPGSLEKTGSGTLTLNNAANTFSGGVVIKAGTLCQTTGAGSLGTGTLTIGDSTGSSSATLLALGSSFTAVNPISVAAGNTGSASIAGGNGSAFVYSGAVTLNNNLTLAANSSGSLRLSGGVTGGAGLNVITNAGTGTGTVTLDTAIISNGAGTVGLAQCSPTSTLRLDTANTFTGGLLVRAGTVASYNNNACGANGSTVTFGDASNQDVTITVNNWTSLNQVINAVGAGAHTIVLNHNNSGQSQTPGQSIVLNSSDLTIRSVNAGSAVRAAGVSGTGNLTVEIQGSGAGYFDFRNGTVNNAGTVTHIGAGSNGLRQAGAVGANVTSLIQNSSTSPWLLDAASSSFAGSVQVLTGTLRVSDADGLNVNNAVTVASGATLDIQDKSLTIATLGDVAGAGGTVTYTNATALRTLTVGGGGDSSFSGVLNGGLSPANMALAKSGSGTLALAGANTYAGGTTINAGTVVLGHPAALGTGGATHGAATLDLHGNAIGNALTISAAGTLANSSATAAALTADATVRSSFTVDAIGDISAPRFICDNPRILTKNGGGTLTTSGTSHNNLLALLQNAGAVVLANTSGRGADRGVIVNGGTLQISGANGNLLNDEYEVTLNAGTLDMNGKSDTAGSLTIGDGVSNAVVTGSGSTYTVNATTRPFAANGAGTNSAIYARSGSVSAILAGSGIPLNKTTAGTVTLSAANTYSGSTTISAGLLDVAASGSIAGSTNVSVAANATAALHLHAASQLNATADLSVGAGSGKVTLDANQTVNSLTLGTRLMWPGTWGSMSSAADYKDDAYFAGTGILTVSTGGLTPATVIRFK